MPTRYTSQNWCQYANLVHLLKLALLCQLDWSVQTGARMVTTCTSPNWRQHASSVHQPKLVPVPLCQLSVPVHRLESINLGLISTRVFGFNHVITLSKLWKCIYSLTNQAIHPFRVSKLVSVISRGNNALCDDGVVKYILLLLIL